MHLKICPLQPNSTQEVGRNTIVFLPIIFRALSSSCVLSNRTECRQGFSICQVSWYAFNFDISTVKRQIMRVKSFDLAKAKKNDRVCEQNLRHSNHKLFLPWNLRYKRLRSRLCTCTYRYQLIIQRTFAGSIFIMAEFSTTSTHLVKDAQMFRGIVLITNQVSVE